MIADKACPVVMRKDKETEILVFRHPLAGIQLVKGTIEQWESASDAALRELAEEAGILDAQITHNMGIWDSGYSNHVWIFYLCQSNKPLPNTWSHLTNDDGSKEFYFFWHPLFHAPSHHWHQVYCDALLYIRSWFVSHSNL